MKEHASNKTIFATIFALLAILFLVYYTTLQQEGSIATPNDSIPTEEVNTNSQENAEQTKILSEANFEWVNAHTELPNDNREVSDWILAQVKDFSDIARADYTELADHNARYPNDPYPLRPYEWQAEYDLATSDIYTSYVYKIYTYTGGAHGMQVVSPYIINTATGKRLESLDDLYTPNVYTFLQDFSRKDLTAQFREKGISAESLNDSMFLDGTEANATNYGVFWFDGDDLIINFGQYQVGPYAIGQFDVKVPLAQLDKYKK